MDFLELKKRRLGDEDLSRKGSIDKPIIDLVDNINAAAQYFTTSSCSGRIVLFENENVSKVKKKGCRWLHVSHEEVVAQIITQALEDITHEAVFKFEPMIMHIQCETLLAAQQMHQVAVAAGFRNSGITVGNKGKTMVAVRSTHGLEAPLTCQGKLLVSQEYVEYLTHSANSKMKMNFAMIERFHQNVVAMLKRPLASNADVKPKKDRRNSKKDQQLKMEKESKAKPKAELTEPDADTMLSMFDDS